MGGRLIGVCDVCFGYALGLGRTYCTGTLPHPSGVQARQAIESEAEDRLIGGA
jgi:hypothetical protein